MKTEVTKSLICGHRETHRFRDEKGNLIPLSRMIRNGPKALYSCLNRVVFNSRPQLPWISYDACDLLTRILPQTASVLEFGSGNSTLYYARNFESVYSVEDNVEWFDQVKKMISQAGLENVEYFLHSGSSYASFEEASTSKFDLAVVDGSIRSACVHTALERLKGDAIIYLDNSDKHPHGGDTRLAEEALLAAVNKRGGRVEYFTDFSPTDFFGNQGMMVLFGRFATL